MDAESHNGMGYYAIEDEALRDVAETVAEQGERSAAVRSLLMYRDGDQGAGISGDELVARALERTRQTTAPQAA